ncbi:hypothetical protein VN97_g8019 [Penicillium thymicola]|uniref:Uncharacterized protein n=1 Tax=Penicillium thymicola TaxID=293382 RepID=A0AAI9X6I7_PENTH|nr:hypothetical protein VN97_g8019 [Penicillium thymicola]
MADIAHSCSGGGDRSRVPLLGAEGGGSCIPDRDKLHLVASQAGRVGRGAMIRLLSRNLPTARLSRIRATKYATRHIALSLVHIAKQ